MKKLFNHTKKEYDRDYDKLEDYEEDGWGMEEEYVDSEAYSEEEYDAAEAETVYSDEEGEYYAEEEYYGDEEGEYYAEEECYGDEEGEYYAEEEYYGDEEGEYYAEEEYYGDEEGEYYAEEEYYGDEEGEYYAEEEYDDDDEDDEDEKVRTGLLGSGVRVDRSGDMRTRKTQKNVLLQMWDKFMEMAVMDRIITGTGVVVLFLAMVMACLYISTDSDRGAVSVLANVGSQLDGIELIGEKGLLAVANAEIAKQAAADIVEEEDKRPEYDEQDYTSVVTVKLNMTSVMKDLKIKFINKDTGKLIANVPFSVTLTDSDGKSETWSDDDMDGIIYKKNITAGKYNVLINELADKKYAGYTIPSVSHNVEVKKDISYEKIDVSDEVKTEDEIDVSKEDTKQNDTEVESTLTDTVEWVESTTVAETYKEISRSQIPDPLILDMAQSETNTVVVAQVAEVRSAFATQETSVSGGDVPAFKMAVSPTAVTVAKGSAVNAQIYVDDIVTNTYKYSVSTDNPATATATVDGNGFITITGMGAGTAHITATVDYADSVGVKAPQSINIDVTVPAAQVKLDKTVAIGYTAVPMTLKATIPDGGVGGVVTVQSLNENVATATVSGTTITVNPIAEGDVAILVVYTENAQTTSETCNVTVKVHPYNNKTDKLKDDAGNQLYVLENETYREAVFADYYTAAKFFIKGDVKHTGWQTIDGQLYFFTKDGDKVTGEQVIRGAKYNFASDGTLITGSGVLGIDVSKWNGKIDWNAVKKSGISYVIIRCGYRGSSKGNLIEDPEFTTNIKGATEAGLKVGVYFFTQATDEIEAVEEASYVIDKIKNYRISYPVFLDVEPSGGRGDKIDKATRTKVCKAFCETIQRAGYTAGIYANKTWLNEKMDVSQLNAYKIWLAQYAATPSYSGKYDMWQYTSKGKVAGIGGDVDLNLSYLGY